MKRLLIMLLMGNRLKQDFGLMMAGQVGRRGSEEVRLVGVCLDLAGRRARQTRTKINREIQKRRLEMEQAAVRSITMYPLGESRQRNLVSSTSCRSASN